jgi:beta-galactosidase
LLYVAGVLLIASAASAASAGELRRTISLDGDWTIGESAMDKPPAAFDHVVPVPGLVDLAKPAFAEVGVTNKLREAFWYRRTFEFDGPVPAVAVLKVHKAMFGTRVILNGVLLGDHLPCFTPGLFDAAKALHTGQNELLIRIGAFRDAIPFPMPDGWDREKTRFTPGIFDSVELILSGCPHILRVQAAPNIEKKSVTVRIWAGPGQGDGAGPDKFTLIVREAKSGLQVGAAECEIPAAAAAEQTGEVTIPVAGCRLWSPEDPFLYTLDVRGAADELSTRFGMRTFRLDPNTGRAMLNGREYFMRGSNVTLYRFFEDAQCGDNPWQTNWVVRLHERFRDMHWNSLRYCVGFPPEQWYRIADEQGFLIQDEFPIWKMANKNGDFDANELAGEYTEWMRERWNHPCVVIWDACNETDSGQIEKAISMVRGLDMSNRPWDNGWGRGLPCDSSEQHPYHFINPNFKLSEIVNDPGTLDWKPGKSAVIVNEYGWLWLNRDGTPTRLTKKLYGNLLGKDSTTEQRRNLYARYLAAETEFWRARRGCAGVLHFCALGYSRAGGQTSDHWTDVEKLTWEPEFYKYVRDAFAPVGVMIDAWAEQYPAGAKQKFPVIATNDLYKPFKGSVRMRILQGEKVFQEKTEPVEVPVLGQAKLTFDMDIPTAAGSYRAEATLMTEGAEPVKSIRDFTVR